MWRVSSEERDTGAVAVIYALSFLVLLTFIGLSIDLGATFAKRQEAQNGADAAALSVAAQCLTNKQVSGCTGDYAAARDIALGNERIDDTASVADGDIQYETPEPYHVTVTVTAEQQAWLLPATTSTESLTVNRSATVNYGSPVAGTVTIPIIASECLFPEIPEDPGTETIVEVWLPQNATKAADAPTGGCEADYPAGGFGWLQGDHCTAKIAVDNTVDSDTGMSSPSDCHQEFGKNYFRDLVAEGATALIPLFEVSSGTGVGGTYHITRFAVFQLTGFQSQTGTLNDAATKCDGPRPSWASRTCFQGKFLTFLEDPGDFELGGPITELTFTRLVG